MVDFASSGLTSSTDFNQVCGLRFSGHQSERAASGVLQADWAFGVQRSANQIYPERATPISRRALIELPSFVCVLPVREFGWRWTGLAASPPRQIRTRASLLSTTPTRTATSVPRCWIALTSFRSVVTRICQADFS